MTGYTVHTGTSVKFSSGWDRIFSGSKAESGATKKATTAKSVKKKAAKKTTTAKAAASAKKKAASKTAKRSK